MPQPQVDVGFEYCLELGGTRYPPTRTPPDWDAVQQLVAGCTTTARVWQRLIAASATALLPGYATWLTLPDGRVLTPWSLWAAYPPE